MCLWSCKPGAVTEVWERRSPSTKLRRSCKEQAGVTRKETSATARPHPPHTQIHTRALLYVCIESPEKKKNISVSTCSQSSLGAF